MRAGVEGGEFFFDEGEEGLDRVVFGLPGEVDGEGGSLVGHAEPEVVGGDGAELGDVEMWGDAVAELLDGEDCFVGVFAGDEVLGLDLSAAAGGEVEFEVGETLVPGAGDAELLGAAFGGVSGDGVEFLRGLLCTEELRLKFFRGCAWIEAALDPDLSGLVVLPDGEEADAVAAEKYLVEVMFELGEGEVFVDDLRDLEGGLEVEGGFGDHAKAAEIDDLTEEVVAVFSAG